MPTLVHLHNGPTMTSVLEDEHTVHEKVDRAREAGDTTVTFTKEGGGDVSVELANIKRVSGQ